MYFLAHKCPSTAFHESGGEYGEMQECKGNVCGMELGFKHFHWDLLQILI